MLAGFVRELAAATAEDAVHIWQYHHGKHQRDLIAEPHLPTKATAPPDTPQQIPRGHCQPAPQG